MNETQHLAKQQWDIHCRKSGLEPEHFGKEININGEIFTIVAFLPRAYRNTVLLRHEKNGKYRSVAADFIKNALHHHTQQEDI